MLHASDLRTLSPYTYIAMRLHDSPSSLQLPTIHVLKNGCDEPHPGPHRQSGPISAILNVAHSPILDLGSKNTTFCLSMPAPRPCPGLIFSSPCTHTPVRIQPAVSARQSVFPKGERQREKREP
ncbi:hypothetical protein B0F90DRAFT_1743235 [Multifurca ochricompacta]|uniref:Uncharacterized protein n=1 Tax=Multifurca ochricompacta TaxID=376703 RepID=A0AAD4LZQ2_9AGAM|nr:hypothetical protein B0F90DRAFT_1743235 [Multifurca ochricompacta]